MPNRTVLLRQPNNASICCEHPVGGNTFEIHWANYTHFKISVTVGWHALLHLSDHSTHCWWPQTHSRMLIYIYQHFYSPDIHFCSNLSLPETPSWVAGLVINVPCLWVVLWSNNRPLNVCENLDFKKDQLWCPTAHARPSLPRCPLWLVSQILMPHIPMLGSEWPLLIKIWIWVFSNAFSVFCMGRSASPAECNFRLGKTGADFIRFSLKFQNVLKP